MTSKTLPCAGCARRPRPRPTCAAALLFAGCLSLACLPSALVAQDDTASSRKAHPDDVEWLIASADVGYRVLDLRKIEYEGEEGARGRIIPAAASGFSPGLGLGMRLWFVSLMLRADVTILNASDGSAIDDELDLWNLDLEGAFRFSRDRLQPYLLVGIGYSALGGVEDVIDNARRAADAHGANLRAGLGFDYYLSEIITVGARGQIDGLLLASRVSVRELAEPEQVDTLGETEDRLREANGSIAGFSYAASLTFGVHAL